MVLFIIVVVAAIGFEYRVAGAPLWDESLREGRMADCEAFTCAIDV
jgi:hypothetical protein